MRSLKTRIAKMEVATEPTFEKAMSQIDQWNPIVAAVIRKEFAKTSTKVTNVKKIHDNMSAEEAARIYRECL